MHIIHRVSRGFGDWLDNFVHYLEIERNLSPATIESYARDLTGFREFLEKNGYTGPRGEIDPAEVGRKQVRNHLAVLARKHSPATVERAAAAIRSFYRFLMREGAVKKNPAALVRTPKKQKKLPQKR